VNLRSATMGPFMQMMRAADLHAQGRDAIDFFRKF
jgi:hypothetical protein